MLFLITAILGKLVRKFIIIITSINDKDFHYNYIPLSLILFTSC